MVLPFYLAFPTVIYLFKINNKNRKTLCEIRPKLTIETNFLQMCSFSIILTCLYSLNLSFLLLFYVISTTTLKFPPSFPASQSWYPNFSYFHPDFPHSHADSPHPYSHSIPRIPTLILRISLIPCPNFPFLLLQIACSVCNL